MIVCFSVIGLLCFTGCTGGEESVDSNALLSVAVNQLKASSHYTITTEVESLSTGIRSEKTEEVTVSGDAVTVVTTYKKPNEIGADEAYTTTTEKKTYSKSDFAGVVFNVDGLSCTIDGNIIEIDLPAKAQVESVFGLKNVSAAKATIKMKNNAFEYLTYYYTTSNQNKVTVTVKN